MRFNITSIAYSWIIAICFMGLISVWTQPPAQAANQKVLVNLPGLNPSSPYNDLDQIKAAAWCALESNQIAVLKTPTDEKRFRGSMAIAPHWRGEPLQQQEQSRLENCIALRLEHTGKNRAASGSDRAALAFLFSDL